MNTDQLDAVMAAIQPGLIQHFFKGADRKSAAELRALSVEFSKVLVRIRLTLSADQFDGEFLARARAYEAELLPEIESEMSNMIRRKFMKLADSQP